MRNNIVQGSDSSETEVFDLIKRIEKGLEKFGTNHRLILGGESYLTDKEISERLKVHRRTLQEYRRLGETPLLHDMRESAVPGVGDRKVTPGFV